ncbi:hypothetical protein EYF80_001187 [Liparis tanakae]|uniref:Uncharacterized protein n=1 Tax=Liparis tanakae TaxID=230148 RepID=A0A4Z2JDP6_9TELE|nr:hypothetical protein EYF80_001187 [Liparis tanakae]
MLEYASTVASLIRDKRGARNLLNENRGGEELNRQVKIYPMTATLKTDGANPSPSAPYLTCSSTQVAHGPAAALQMCSSDRAASRYGVEVSGEVILIHHGGSGGWLQQLNPQISDGEEVPQVLGGIQLAVQRGHVVKPRPGKEGKAILDLKAYRLVVLPHIASGVVLSADDIQQGALGEVVGRLGLHGERVQAVGGVELVRGPGPAVVEGFFQDHLLRSARLEVFASH